MRKEPAGNRALPRTAFHVLLALGKGELHGWAIRERIEALTDGAVRPGPGTLYESIAGLEEQGLVEETGEPDDARAHAQRRYFRLTVAGRRVLSGELDRLARIVEHADAAGLRLRDRAEGGT